MNKIIISILTLSSFTANSASQWSTNIKSDDFNDTKTGTIHLVADKGMGKFGRKSTLTLRCKTGQNIEAFINWQQYMAKNSIKVDFRFDKKKAETGVTTNASTDGKASFIRQQNIDSFIKNLKVSQKLLARGYDYNGTQSVAATFIVDGFKKAYAETCGWRVKQIKAEKIKRAKQIKAEKVKKEQEDQKFQDEICKTYPTNPGCPGEILTISDIQHRIELCDVYPDNKECKINWKARLKSLKK